MKYRALAVGVSISWLAGQAVAASDFSAIQKQLGIPSAVGVVVDASGKIPEFILIQDIHRHPEAQANIAAMLLHAFHHWNVGMAYLEGAYAGQSVSDVMSDEPLRTQLSAGKLSGAEVASAMLRAGDLRLVGLENADIYKENVQAYQAAMDHLSQALQEIKTIRMLQQTLDLSAQRFTEEELNRLELLARLKLKPSEYSQYLADRAAHPLPPLLAQILEPAEHFYQLADRRSSIFLQEASRRDGHEPKAIVIGGFHTAEMAKQLRASGKSFVVLAPRVTQSGFDELYTQGMNDTISALKLR